MLTVSEKRDLVGQNKKSEFLMLVGRLNPLQCCVKMQKNKTLNTRRDSRPDLPYCSRAIEVRSEKTLIEVPFPV